MNDITLFYIHRQDGKFEGPFDLPMMMRKMRTGKFTPESLVSTEADSRIRPAGECAEIASFFHSNVKGAREEKPRRPGGGSITMQSLRTGWKFISQQPMLCAIAGFSVLLTYIAGLLIVKELPWWFALWAWASLYIMMQSMLMITVQRLFRGQYLDADFVNRQLGPAIPRLVLYSVVLAMLATVGMLFAVLPGLFLLSVFAFVPCLLADKRMDLANAMNESMRISFRGGFGGFIALLGLAIINLVSAVTIFVLPVMLPMLAAAYAELYDQWAHY